MLKNQANLGTNTMEKENEIIEVKKEDLYDINVNHMNVNPFSNYIVNGLEYMGEGIGLSLLSFPIAISSAAIASSALGLIAGIGMVSGIGLIGIGFLMEIPSLLAAGGYEIYKYFLKSDYEKFFENFDSDEKKQEREVYNEIINQMNNHFQRFINFKEKEIKEKIENIMNNILELYSKVELECLEPSIKDYLEKYSNISKFNILVIGKTGVGKSTLINGVLDLNEDVQAKEGNEGEAQKIKGWKKKYPINENDKVSIKGLNIWDTEGIEFSAKKDNNIARNREKVENLIEEHKAIPNEQINCLWYCINGNIIEEEEIEYITSLLDTYEKKNKMENLKDLLDNYKFPIIFVYTQAYGSEEKNINAIKGVLNKIDYFKENPKEFKFINVIAKDYSYNIKKNKIIEEKENIDKLIDLSIKLGKKGMSFPLFLNANILYKEINEKYNHMLNNLQPISTKLIKTILNSHSISIFSDACPILRELIKALCLEKLDQQLTIDINNHITKIIKIMENIYKDCIEIAFIHFNKDSFASNLKDFIKKKYQEKKNKKISQQKFEDNCKNFLIDPIINNVRNYGILFLFLFIRQIIINYSYNYLNTKLIERKENIKKKFEQYSEENYERFIKQTNFNYQPNEEEE